MSLRDHLAAFGAVSYDCQAAEPVPHAVHGKELSAELSSDEKKEALQQAMLGSVCCCVWMIYGKSTTSWT